MISGTYILSGMLLVISALLFNAGALNATTQTICWCVIFFFASAGASAAYLTVSEIFPVEVRAKAIAVFFAIAQSFGAFGPWLYGKLIGNGQDHFKLFIGYLIGAGRHDRSAESSRSSSAWRRKGNHSKTWPARSPPSRSSTIATHADLHLSQAPTPQGAGT